jgi:hypothetical protein
MQKNKKHSNNHIKKNIDTARLSSSHHTEWPHVPQTKANNEA